jgi:hypothetical protein
MDPVDTEEITINEVDAEIRALLVDLERLKQLRGRLVDCCKHDFSFERDCGPYPEHSWRCTKCGHIEFGGAGMYRK